MYRTPVAQRVAAILPHGERRTGRHRRHQPERRATRVSVREDARHLPRRSGRERRETASGHVRNAIQLLGVATAYDPSGAEERAAVNGATRRLWLALREIELGNPGSLTRG